MVMVLDFHIPTYDVEPCLVLFLPPFTPRPFIHLGVLPLPPHIRLVFTPGSTDKYSYVRT